MTVEDLTASGAAMGGNEVRTAALHLLHLVGPTALAASAADIAGATSAGILADRLGRPDAAEAISRLVRACREWGPERAEPYLLGLADGRSAGGEAVELVWTGPTVHGVPVRNTARALVGVVAVARRELWLTTYSAKAYAPLVEALQQALVRGVVVSVVIETLAGAGSAISGSEPAHAFTGIDGLLFYGWPPGLRPKDAKLHSKLAVADSETLLVTSANLTAKGLEHNLEAGVLVTGGSAPQRAAEHLRALVRNGTLERI